jgi:hypothetical protein
LASYRHYKSPANEREDVDERIINHWADVWDKC